MVTAHLEEGRQLCKVGPQLLAPQVLQALLLCEALMLMGPFSVGGRGVGRPS